MKTMVTQLLIPAAASLVEEAAAPDWTNLIAGGLAIAFLLGGMLMMFTTVWTTKRSGR
jgi:hypothetical protein